MVIFFDDPLYRYKTTKKTVDSPRGSEEVVGYNLNNLNLKLGSALMNTDFLESLRSEHVQ